MATNRSNYLIGQLITNKLTSAELDEFLAGLNSEEDLQAYSDVLETYFKALLDQSGPSEDSDEPVNRLLNNIKSKP